MKKWSMILASLALTAALITPVMAAGPGYGRGPDGRGPGKGGPGYAQLTEEQRAEITKARAEFLNETAELRKQIAAKRIDLRTLWAQPNADQAKIKAMSDELVDLKAQMSKKRNEYQAKYPNMGFGRGYGRGFKRGFGPGNCPGYGPGYGPGGPGGPGGQGRGACWR